MCMATKTISVDLEAYDMLRAARIRPDESFAKVIKRAYWKTAPHTAGEYLAAVRAQMPADEATIETLDTMQREDTIPP